MEDYTSKYKGEQVEVALFGGEYQEGVLTAYCYLEDVAHVELRFPRAHYEGERTRWSGSVTEIARLRSRMAPLVSTIDRCEIEGCREGTPITWCREADDTHFCE